MKTIRQLREERGETQLQVAIALGVTPATVYNWERGKYEPTASMFRRIALTLGVPMEEIALVGIDVPDEGKGEAAA